MRIQHNIPAMNSLTNYTRNNNALAGNLEKLSSGYRINSAADDAAGLAISEKMRSQIKGLEKAYDNANDGISLVQTAEGALTEVNSMLTRLTELATQSANGTYQDDVDREAIQDETNALLDEIDRISDATNFNGIDLLNGNLAGGGKAGAATGVITGTTLADSLTKSAEIAGIYKFSAPTGTVAAGTTYEFTLSYTDKSGNEQTKTLSYTTTSGTVDANLIDKDGNKITLGATATIATIAQQAYTDFAKDEDIAANFNLTTAAAGTADFTALDKGTAGAKVNAISMNTIDSTGAVTATTGISTATGGTVAKDVYNTFDVTKATVWDPADEKTLADAIFEVNGEKFVFIKNGTTLSDDMRKTLNDAGVGNNYVIAAGAALVNGDAANMANVIKAATGLDAAAGQIDAANGNAWTPGTTGTLIGFKADASASSGSAGGGKGLVLQIGDTNDDFNKVTVSIDDMGADALGLRNATVNGVATLNLSDQDTAGDAIKTIKDAVNKVSAQRGKLGALQNRLDHTLNNLDATTENITSSESQIRDVNMAKEMTAYTKNNILAQAAQSMLAQANSMPQGVLQLLQ